MRFLPASLACVMLSLTPELASPGAPDPGNSRAPASMLIGACPVVPYCVLVQDAGGAPLAGVVVRLEFCDTQISVFTQQYAGTTINCVEGRLSRVTDPSGNACFLVRATGDEPNPAIEVFAGDVQVGAANTKTTDYNGFAGTDISDLATFTEDYLSTGPPNLRSDFNGDLLVDVSDFSALVANFLNNGCSPGGLTYCPGNPIQCAK